MPFPIWFGGQHKSGSGGQGGDIGRVFNLLVYVAYEAGIVHRTQYEVV